MVAWCSGQFAAITAAEKAVKLRNGVRLPALK